MTPPSVVVSQQNTQPDPKPEVKRTRIWAACEPCRHKKSKCNGQHPCSCCLTTARVAVGSPHTHSLSREEHAARVREYAASACIVDHNRKPRGPRAKPRLSVETDPSSSAAAAAAAAAPPTHRPYYAPRSQGPPGHDLRSDEPYYRREGEEHFDPRYPPPLPPQSRPSFNGQDHRDSYDTNPPRSTYARSSELRGEGSSRAAPRAAARSARGINDTGLPPLLPPQSRPDPYPASSSNGNGHNPRPWDVYQTHSQAPSRGSLPRSGSSTDLGSNPPQSPWTQLPSPAPPRHHYERGHSYHQDNSPTTQAPPGQAGTSRMHRSEQQSPRMYDAPSPSLSDPRSALQFIMSPSFSSASPRGTGAESVSTAPTSYGAPSVSAHGHTSASNRHTPEDAFSAPRPCLPPLMPSARSHPLARRVSHSVALVNVGTDFVLRKLSNFYTEQDRPYVALAIAQYADLDATTKLFPSRYIFGRAETAPETPETPEHLQLAMLSLLAHRALLLPDSHSPRDLDAAVAAADSGPPQTFQGGAPLEGAAREGMLLFARRSWNVAHDMLLRSLAEGVVDPSLVQTGWLLDMGASEDGIGSTTMRQFKAWLFEIVHAWQLDKLDTDPRIRFPLAPMDPAAIEAGDDSDPDAVGVRHAHPGSSTGPQPRPADARHIVTDPVDRESLRRVVMIIAASYLWTHSSDGTAIDFDLQNVEVNLPQADDAIHVGSAWTPERLSSDGFLLRTNHVAWRLFGRTHRMLHTPLSELVAGDGPEPDLQRAIDDIEDVIDQNKSRVPKPIMDHPANEAPLQSAGFIHTRLTELMAYRLFAAIAWYTDLCATTDAADSASGTSTEGGVKKGPSLSTSAGSHLVPLEDDMSMFEAFSGFRPGEDALLELLASSMDLQAALSSLDAPKTATPPVRARIRPRFRRDPHKASLAPLLEVRDVVEATLARIDSSRSPLEGEVGTAAGVPMSSSARSIRWPRHLSTFAQHAFAMAAELRVAGESWRGVENAAAAMGGYAPPFPTPAPYAGANGGAPGATSEPFPSGLPSAGGAAPAAAGAGDVPYSSSPEMADELWSIGERIICLLHAMARTGSEHARQTARSTEAYREGRIAWVGAQLQSR